MSAEAACPKLRCFQAYSPDLNPSEQAFSKLKAAPRKCAARTIPRLLKLIPKLIRSLGSATKHATGKWRGMSLWGDTARRAVYAAGAVSRAAKAERFQLSAEAIMPDTAAFAGEREPRGMLSIRTLCIPADTNQNGDIFGGWLLGQMDIAGGIFAHTLAKGRTVTVAVDAMTFKKPVRVGDVIWAYADLIRIGTTSIAVHVEAWAIPRNETKQQLVTEGNFTYVAIDEAGRPRKVPT